ncbi:MAG: M48 family metallopeptidase [Lachnospiraceae bacterium]
MPKEELVKIAGLSVLLVRSSRKTLAVQIRADGTVIARAPLRMPKDRILCFLSEKASWIRMQQGRMQEREKMRQQARIHLDAAQEKELRERAKSVLAQRTAYFARQIGVTYGRITVRDQKTRWGSCSQTGNLNFNFRLILAPLEVLDYVVVHELCHRRQMNHSTQFWQEVAQVLPDYRKRKAWLTENGWRLMGELCPASGIK